MMSVTCYLLLTICYTLSDTCYLKLATSCKNLIPFAPVVRLALVLVKIRFFLVLFIVLKSHCREHTVSTQKSVWKTTQPEPRYLRKTKLVRGLVWHAMLKHIFANISAQGGSFFKPIFALKPCVQDGRFEYNKR